MALLIGLLYILFFMGLSWLLTCALVYAICWCFALEFTWLLGTGVWLVSALVRSILCKN